MKYAVQVSNYLPVKLTNGQVSTPHELAHGTTPDYRKLIPIFAIGYTKVDSTTSSQNDKLDSQTIPTILIGNDDQSDGCLFYNPVTKHIISSSDYRLDHSRPSGPIFNLPYEQQGFGFSIMHSENQSMATPPPFTLGNSVYVTTTKDNGECTSQRATILNIPLSDTLPYTVQFPNGQVQEEYLQSLSSHNPMPHTVPDSTELHLLHPWITHGSKVTVFFSNKMSAPKQGYYLYRSNTNQWSFIPGRSTLKNNKNLPIPLPNFTNVAPSLIQNGLIAQHWITSKSFMDIYN